MRSCRAIGGYECYFLAVPEGFIHRSHRIPREPDISLAQILGRRMNYPICEEIVGLIPAGGQARRLGALPCSKKLYPIRVRKAEQEGVLPKVACHYTLEKMRTAGITQIYIVLKEGKWDIPSYLRDGADVHLAYLTLGLPFGVHVGPGLSVCHNKTVAQGFADILFHV